MNKKYQAVWRKVATRTHGFPKLMVADNVVTGSINIRGTRLSLWAIITTAITDGWDVVERSWCPKDYNYSEQDLAHFLYCLLEQRGEFGRLLLLLANVERPEYKGDLAWWENPRVRRRVMKQLQNCLDALSQVESDIEL